MNKIDISMIKEARRTIVNGRVILLANMKGGVGKTFSVVALAYELANKGYKVCVVDADPQGSSSSALRSKTLDGFHMGNLLMGECDLEDVIKQTEYDNLYVIPSDLRLIENELTLRQAQLYNKKELVKYLDNCGVELTEEQKELLIDYGNLNDVMKDNVIGDLKEIFDFVLIDSSPYYNSLVENALYSTDYVIVPAKMDLFALEGFDFLMGKLNIIKRERPQIKVLGILPTLFKKSNIQGGQVEKIKDKNIPIFKECHHTVKADEAVMQGVPITKYAPYSKLGLAYKNNVDQILEMLEEEAI